MEPAATILQPIGCGALARGSREPSRALVAREDSMEGRDRRRLRRALQSLLRVLIANLVADEDREASVQRFLAGIEVGRRARQLLARLVRQQAARQQVGGRDACPG